MDITFTQPDNFKISSKQLSIGLGSQATGKQDLLLSSQPLEEVTHGAVSFDGPGEYEVKGCMITGVATQGKTDTLNTAYQLSVDDLRVGYLGGTTKPLSDQQLEQLGAIDVLMISLADNSAGETSKQISAIEPSIMLPMNYDQKSLDELAKEMGIKVDPQEKLKVNKKELPADIVLTVLS